MIGYVQSTTIIEAVFSNRKSLIFRMFSVEELSSMLQRDLGWIIEQKTRIEEQYANPFDIKFRTLKTWERGKGPRKKRVPPKPKDGDNYFVRELRRMKRGDAVRKGKAAAAEARAKL